MIKVILPVSEIFVLKLTNLARICAHECSWYSFHNSCINKRCCEFISAVQTMPFIHFLFICKFEHIGGNTEDGVRRRRTRNSSLQDRRVRYSINHYRADMNVVGVIWCQFQKQLVFNTSFKICFGWHKILMPVCLCVPKVSRLAKPYLISLLRNRRLQPQNIGKCCENIELVCYWLQ